MSRTGVKGKGGLTVRLGKGDSVYIGDDIEVMVQKNNSSNSKLIVLRIIAPKDKKIVRSNLIKKEV